MIIRDKKKYIGFIYYLVLSLFSLLVGYISFGKGFDFDVFFSFGGDGTLGAALIKGIQENGFFGMWFNDRIGAPDASSLIDFPSSDILMYSIIWVITWFTDSTPAIQYIYYIITFVLNAVSMSLLLRKMGVNRDISFVISLLFTFAPYHFYRYLGHSSLTNHISIPIAIYLSLYVLGQIQELKKWKIIFCAFLLGFGYGYFYAFGLILIAVATLIQFLKSDDKKESLKSLWIIAIVLLFILLSLMPGILYSMIEGKNPLAGKRDWMEQEIYGLKIINLLLPVTYHRIDGLRSLTQEYLSKVPIVSESYRASLGTVASVGFILLCAALIYSFVCKKKMRQAEWELVDFLSLSTLVFVLMGSIGGFGLIFNWFVTSQIRCYNRMSIFIMAFALIMIALLVDKMNCKSIWLRRVFCIILLAVGMYDQLNINSGYWQTEIAQQQQNYETFFAKVEAALPEEAMVYQLPHMDFPETGNINNMHDYEPFLGYLFTDNLRWSYGGVKGRNTAAQNLYIDEGMSQEFLKNIKDAGFQAVYIDLDGYEDNGNEILKYYNDLGLQPMISLDKTIYVYDISSYTPKNIPYERACSFLMEFAQNFDVEIQAEAVDLVCGICDMDAEAINTVYAWMASDLNVQSWSEEDYINSMYELLLGRDASQEECSSWMVSEMDREEIFHSFITSSEFRTRFSFDKK